MGGKSKDVTKQVTQFYKKLESALNVIQKRDNNPIKYARLLQGKAILKDLGVNVTNNNIGAQDFVTHMVTAIDRSISKNDSKEYIEDKELFEKIIKFFNYV